MAGKTFVNTTNYSLLVQLTVRKGDQPGHTLNVVNFTLGEGVSSYIGYGDDQNPYLDGISVNATDQGNIITSQNFVTIRGSSVDNDFNINDHVTFSLNHDSLVLSYSNG